jgi:hypothetical protein
MIQTKLMYANMNKINRPQPINMLFIIRSDKNGPILNRKWSSIEQKLSHPLLEGGCSKNISANFGTG